MPLAGGLKQQIISFLTVLELEAKYQGAIRVVECMNLGSTHFSPWDHLIMNYTLQQTMLFKGSIESL